MAATAITSHCRPGRFDAIVAGDTGAGLGTTVVHGSGVQSIFSSVEGIVLFVEQTNNSGPDAIRLDSIPARIHLGYGGDVIAKLRLGSNLDRLEGHVLIAINVLSLISNSGIPFSRCSIVMTGGAGRVLVIVPNGDRFEVTDLTADNRRGTGHIIAPASPVRTRLAIACSQQTGRAGVDVCGMDTNLMGLMSVTGRGVAMAASTGVARETSSGPVRRGSVAAGAIGMAVTGGTGAARPTETAIEVLGGVDVIAQGCAMTITAGEDVVGRRGGIGRISVVRRHIGVLHVLGMRTCGRNSGMADGAIISACRGAIPDRSGYRNATAIVMTGGGVTAAVETISQRHDIRIGTRSIIHGTPQINRLVEVQDPHTVTIVTRCTGHVRGYDGIIIRSKVGGVGVGAWLFATPIVAYLATETHSIAPFIGSTSGIVWSTHLTIIVAIIGPTSVLISGPELCPIT